MSLENLPGTETSTLSVKRADQYFNEIKDLPIRMEDRRNLYNELLEMHEFENEILNKGPLIKRICCFRLRKAQSYLKYYYNRFTLWESSLREIEIQRGTLTVNVFLFIKWTLRFNLVLTVIVFFLMLLPQYSLYVYFVHVDKSMVTVTCNNHTFEAAQHRNGSISPWELAECCSEKFEKSQPSTPYADPTLQNIQETAETLGGVKTTWLNSFLFYGFYRPPNRLRVSLRQFVPMLYVIATVIVFAFSVWVLVRNIGMGIREMVKNKESETAIFADLVFCGYHYRAEDEKDSRFRRKLWLHELKVSLRRAKALTKVKPPTDIALIFKRIMVFIGTAIIIGLTGIAIGYLSEYSYDHSERVLSNTANHRSIDANVATILWGLLPSLALSICNFILPNVFIKLSRFEKYNLEVTTAVVLLRSLIVRLLSIFVTTRKIFTNNYCPLKKNSCIACSDDHEGKEGHYCWESLIGQALYKVIIVELIVKLILTFILDPLRKAMGRAFGGFKLMRKIGTLRFNIIRQSLDIINIQVLCWVGFYFAPAYPIIVCFYLVITFYLKKFAVLHNCVGSPESHRVTRTTTIFQMGELFSLLIVTGFLTVVLGQLHPSNGCGPFAAFPYPWRVITEGMEKVAVLNKVVHHIGSPSVYIPLEILGLTFLYYLYCVVVVNREATSTTKDIIKMESDDKLFLITKLQSIRSKFKKNTHFYDSTAIYESEKKFLLSAHQQKKNVGMPTKKPQTSSAGSSSSSRPAPTPAPAFVAMETEIPTNDVMGEITITKKISLDDSIKDDSKFSKKIRKKETVTDESGVKKNYDSIKSKKIHQPPPLVVKSEIVVDSDSKKSNMVTSGEDPVTPKLDNKMVKKNDKKDKETMGDKGVKKETSKKRQKTGSTGVTVKRRQRQRTQTD